MTDDGTTPVGRRRVIGRSRAAETRDVVIDPSAPPAPAREPVPPPVPPPAAPPDPPARPEGPAWDPAGHGPPVGAVPPPVAVPGAAPGERVVLGSSRTPVDAAPAAPPRPVLGSSGGRGGAPPPPVPTPSGPAPPRRPGRRRRPPVGRLLLAALALLVVMAVGLFGFGWWQYSKVPKVDVSSALTSAASGTNYLIVGTDSRAGITASDPNAGAFLGGPVSGSRTDTIMVLHMGAGGSKLLSIPRDLWVTNPATGEKGRINSTFAQGPANLITAVTKLGIPVQHYMEIDFVSFSKLVDAVGGITIDFPAPARDTHSGLQIDKAGPVHLDGEQALAYVRSRYYEQLVNGKWQTDPTADIGRTERQRAFLTALMDKVGSTRNPFTLLGLPSRISSGIKVDSTLGYLGALKLLWAFRSFHPATVALPVTPRTTSGGAEVLDLKQPDAGPVIGAFG